MLIKYLCNEHGRFQLSAICPEAYIRNSEMLFCSCKRYIKQAAQFFNAPFILSVAAGRGRKHGIRQIISTAWLAFLFPEAGIGTGNKNMFKLQPLASMCCQQVYTAITAAYLYKW